ncbi:Sporulation related domain-containing protein [Insolitispirillum peregrinum]|uniref:Sporulation related domain-containing protein n=2 Tax=Insolitispirillum peregrinum TaxID=80876 RepID=A0A1N7Q5K5_9PROT|nr:Sporulation related domain-containing protein [Insolitispirillum peregrinum]
MRQDRLVKPMRAAFTASLLMAGTVMLSGCLQTLPILEAGQGLQSTQPNGQYYINQAMAGLALGDYRYAEQMSDQALAAEPANPVALLAAGAIYQKTNRQGEARSAYQAAASVPNGVSIPGDLWGLNGTYPVRDIARHALAQIDGQSLNTSTPVAVPLAPMAVGNAMGRHAILKALRDRNLITPEEYEPRRSAPVPSTMRGPVPSVDEVADRLEQLSQAYATRNMSAEQHAAEREVILDSLVPDPSGHTDDGLGVTSRKAVPTPPKPPEAAKPPAENKPAEAKKPEPPSGSDVGVQNPNAVLRSGRDPLQIIPYDGKTVNGGGASVQLATFHSRDGAMKGWENLKNKFPDLKSLQPRISTDSDGEQGTIFRLNAGPLPDMEAAKALCGKLKEQFCEAVMLGG